MDASVHDELLWEQVPEETQALAVRLWGYHYAQPREASEQVSAAYRELRDAADLVQERCDQIVRMVRRVEELVDGMTLDADILINHIRRDP